MQEAPDTTWAAIDQALTYGFRGLRGGSSLANLLDRSRTGKLTRTPRLSIDLILEWADAFHGRTERWPTRNSGAIPESPGETWLAVDHALRFRRRGLQLVREGTTLATLLLARRDVRSVHTVPPLTIEQILQWAREHYEREGAWPTSISGPIPGSGGDTWKTIDYALANGRRGLEAGSSVARLLAEHRLKPNLHSMRELTYTKILHWADLHFEETEQ